MRCIVTPIYWDGNLTQGTIRPSVVSGIIYKKGVTGANKLSFFSGSKSGADGEFSSRIWTPHLYSQSTSLNLQLTSHLQPAVILQIFSSSHPSIRSGFSKDSKDVAIKNLLGRRDT